MISPTSAMSRPERPITPMQDAFLALVLSATSKRVLILIMDQRSPGPPGAQAGAALADQSRSLSQDGRGSIFPRASSAFLLKAAGSRQSGPGRRAWPGFSHHGP